MAIIKVYLFSDPVFISPFDLINWIYFISNGHQRQHLQVPPLLALDVSQSVLVRYFFRWGRWAVHCIIWKQFLEQVLKIHALLAIPTLKFLNTSYLFLDLDNHLEQTKIIVRWEGVAGSFEVGIQALPGNRGHFYAFLSSNPQVCQVLGEGVGVVWLSKFWQCQYFPFNWYSRYTWITG